MIEALFFIPVCTADTERVLWTVESIRKYCPGSRMYLLLDGPQVAQIDARIYGNDMVIRENQSPTGRHWGKIWQMQCQAMVDTLDDPLISKSAIFVKIDADALVLRTGLVERAQAIFRHRPSVGQLGQCFTNILGGRLHNAGWANYYRKMHGWRGLLRFLRSGSSSRLGTIEAVRAYWRFRTLLNQARANGYVDGEFAIGGAYILRREVVKALAAPGRLEHSPFLFLHDTGEDGVMTPYVYAAGYSAMDDVSDGGLFAIEGKAIRMDPFLLKNRGHYIIHPTKYGHKGDSYNFSESELVQKLIA